MPSASRVCCSSLFFVHYFSRSHNTIKQNGQRLLLVAWVKVRPIRYSVMTRGDLTELRDQQMLAADLIQHELKFKWGENCIGKVLSTGKCIGLIFKFCIQFWVVNGPFNTMFDKTIGPKSDLECEMLQLIEEAKSKSKGLVRPKIKRSKDQVCQIVSSTFHYNSVS